MARIRTIKPDFWTSAQIIECSPIARLLFIGLWNFCDDKGRHSWSPRQIMAQVFPGDTFATEDVSRLLDELSTNGLIVKYTVDGKDYLQVTGWHHQKIDRPQKPVCPDPLDEHSTNGSDGREGKGKDRKGKEAAQPVSEERAGAQSPPDEPEPSRKTELDRIEAECREAAGLENDPSPSLFDTSPLNELLAKGYTLSGDILPRLRAAKAKGKRGKTWSYYVPIITEGKAANEAVPAKAEALPGKRTVWVLCDDRRWLYLAERYAKEHEGRRPPTTSGDGGMGWRFPPEWVDAADLEIPECLRRTA